MTLHLDLTDGTTFTTHDANWDITQTWNGFPAPRLPKWKAYALFCLLEESTLHPHLTRAEPDGDESDYVTMDGLTWYV